MVKQNLITDEIMQKAVVLNVEKSGSPKRGREYQEAVVDNEVMLKDTNKKIRQLFEQLKWVDGDSHVELTPKYVIPIELVEEISVHCKIKVPTESQKEYCVVKFDYQS